METTIRLIDGKRCIYNYIKEKSDPIKNNFYFHGFGRKFLDNDGNVVEVEYYINNVIHYVRLLKDDKIISRYATGELYEEYMFDNKEYKRFNQNGKEIVNVIIIDNDAVVFDKLSVYICINRNMSMNDYMITHNYEETLIYNFNYGTYCYIHDDNEQVVEELIRKEDLFIRKQSDYYTYHTDPNCFVESYVNNETYSEEMMIPFVETIEYRKYKIGDYIVLRSNLCQEIKLNDKLNDYENIPAYIEYGKLIIHYKDGIMHCENNYAVVMNENGIIHQMYKINGLLHKFNDNPSFVLMHENYSKKLWCVDGKLHRENDCAVEIIINNKIKRYFYLDGKKIMFEYYEDNELIEKKCFDDNETVHTRYRNEKIIYRRYVVNGEYIIREDDIDESIELTNCGTCCVCYEDNELRKIKKCSHIICINCLSAWLEKKNTCPLCRGDINDYVDHESNMDVIPVIIIMIPV